MRPAVRNTKSLEITDSVLFGRIDLKRENCICRDGERIPQVSRQTKGVVIFISRDAPPMTPLGSPSIEPPTSYSIVIGFRNWERLKAVTWSLREDLKVFG
ncbi:hypothetical protein ACMFMG_003653 [Clarireedia jacksonii]